MASTKAQIAKEKGNTAFKAGDYPAAIGHYTSAILEDRKDITFPLNRAAAYLKLGKNEDADRDCSTVLSLSPSNAKALFRRGQARTGIGKYSDAEKDFKAAFQLEPANESIGQELKKLKDLIQASEAKRIAKGKGLASISSPSSAPIPSSASVKAVPKRRRIPITIVEPSESDGPSKPSPNGNVSLGGSSNVAVSPGDNFIKPLSSRSITSTPLNPSAAPSSPSTPKASTFQDAKQARETAKPSRAGGGIFRPGGNHTIFAPRLEAPSRPSPSSSASTSGTPSGNGATDPIPNPTLKSEHALFEKAPMTLFNFTKLWDSLTSTDQRWALLSNVPPSSLPSLFKSSLESQLLVSILRVLLTSLKQQRASPEDVRDYMVNFARVPRFSTVLLFMGKDEKQLAKEIWTLLGENGSSVNGWKFA